MGWLGLSVCFSFALGDTLFLKSAQAAGLPTAQALGALYPIWSALAGWVFKGQNLSALGVLGLFLSVGGVIGVITSDLKGPPREGGSRHYVRGVFLALLTSLLWAGNVIAVSQVGAELPIGVMNLIRMGLGAVFIVVFARVVFRQRMVMMSRQDVGRNMWAFVLEGVGGCMSYTYGVGHAPLALGSVLCGMSPVITAPAFWFLRLERFSLIKLAGIISTVAGVGLLLSSR
jgi:drug/metabolite transporter (DMT)-like permease